jgi:hypothetical protein
MMTGVRCRARDETRHYIRRIASLMLQAHLTALERDTRDALADLL